MNAKTLKEPPEEDGQTELDSTGDLSGNDANATSQDGEVELEVHVDPPKTLETDQATAGRGVSQEQLIETVHKLREEAIASRERMLRIAADADNLRKRVLKDRKDIEKFSQENLLRDLLTPLDNLERTLGYIPEAEQDSALKSLKEGIEMVLHQFWSALSDHNLTRVDACKGAAFDPTRHEALCGKETDETEPGTILSVLQRGYQLHDRLLRPVMVEVACAPGMNLENEPACSDREQPPLENEPTEDE